MPTRKPWRYWARIIVGTVIGSVLVVVLFSGETLRAAPLRVVQGLAISLVFGLCIALLMGVAMPRIMPWFWRRLPFPWQWIAAILTMAAFATAGSIVAIGVLTAVGYAPPSRFWTMLADSVKFSIVVTLTVGLFITMYEQMKATAERTAVQAQLASLESRVQPHFLFNTLNSIAALIHQDPHGAERMTLQLASLLRSSLDQQATPLVPLADELRIVQDYLAIERVRFGDRLRYTIDAEDAALAARIPRLALQTLIENSVKYAVSPRREGGSIAVHASDTPRAVRIVVEDDGPGFDAATLPEGHGLALLRDRLALLFGDRVGLTFDARSAGTRVELTVPHTHDVPSPTRRPAASDQQRATE
jgi:two-component system, LytTR family, sensor histidine kinase AlgZ